MRRLDPSAGSDHVARMPAALIVVLLALLLGVQPITTDLYLPTLPALQGQFGAGMAQFL